MAAEEDSEECTSKLLSTITQNYLQRRRKSSRRRTTSCLTASSFRHHALLVSPVALIKLHRRARSRVAWTEFGGVGEGRRAILTQIDRKRQARGHPGVDPVITIIPAL